MRRWLPTARCIADALDPTQHLAAWRMDSHPLPQPVTVVSVYRQRNSRSMLSIVRDADAAGFCVRLWALEETSHALAEWTVGVGTGGRFELLNRALPPMRAGYVVVVDDDVTFVRGAVSTLVRLADWLRLDVARPAHALGSACPHLSDDDRATALGDP